MDRQRLEMVLVKILGIVMDIMIYQQDVFDASCAFCERTRIYVTNTFNNPCEITIKIAVTLHCDR